jgi:predicted acyl esterase
VALFLLWAAPANAFSKQTGFRTMADGTKIAYDLYTPGGTPPAGGWPGVVVLHGLGGSKDDMAPIAGVFVAQGYAALAYTARGEGTSTGNLELAGPSELSDERAMESWFASQPNVNGKEIGAWGISYGGGQVWNGLGAHIPYAAAEVVETWTDLYSALWPGNVAKSGIVLGFAKAVDSRSPLIQQYENDAIHSTNLGAIRALVAPRSVYQQFGHTPSAFPGPDFSYVMAKGVAWFDHYLRGVPNGIDKTPPVTIAAATGTKRASFAGIPKTRKLVLPLTGPQQTSARMKRAVETFGVSTIRVRVKASHFPALVATVLAGNRVITHGAVVPRNGVVTIHLANYVQYVPKGARLRVTFGSSSSAGDIAYLAFPAPGSSLSVGKATLTLSVLTKPISG